MLSTVAALAAAAIFALTTNLQREAASSVPAHGNGPVRLVRALLASPRWLLGGLLGLIALGLHAVALAHGSVTVVQSVMAVGLVLALSLEALRNRRRLRPAEWGGAVMVVIGVIGVVTVGEPGRPGPSTRALAWGVCAAVALTTLVAVVRSRRAVGGDGQARLLAAAGGACLAVDAVFLQRVAEALQPGHGLLTALGTDWSAMPPGAGWVVADAAGFLLASLVGGVAVHRAYQVAPLRTVQPAVAAAEPVTALLVGFAVLGEGVRGGVLGGLLLIGGLAAIVGGIFLGLRPSEQARLAPSVLEAARSHPAPVPGSRRDHGAVLDLGRHLDLRSLDADLGTAPAPAPGRPALRRPLEAAVGSGSIPVCRS